MKWAIPILLTALAACAVPSGEDDKAGKRRGASQANPDEPAAKPAADCPNDTAATTTTLKADNTLLLVAGVLKWPSDQLNSFDPVNRRDKALHELFVGPRGVPEARAKLLLDEQATRAAILGSLRSLVAEARSDDTVLFYFAGHGARDEAKKNVYLANYDIDVNRLAETGLTIPDIASAFDEAPERLGVILLGDFCFSGALRIAAEQLAGRGLRATSVTSADVSNVSTGSWTYTQTMLQVFSGFPLGDRNGDGAIDLGEAGAEVHDAMKYVELQRSSFMGSNTNFVLSTVSEGPRFGTAAPAALAPGSYASLGGGDGRVVRVRALSGDVATVHHLRYADGEELTVPVRSLQPIAFKTYAKGTPVRVEWEGTAYSGTVKQIEDHFHLVSYSGFDSSWDEWVLSNRILGGGN